MLVFWKSKFTKEGRKTEILVLMQQGALCSEAPEEGSLEGPSFLNKSLFCPEAESSSLQKVFPHKNQLGPLFLSVSFLFLGEGTLNRKGGGEIKEEQ